MIFFIDDALTNLQLLRQTMKRHVLERPIPVVVVVLRFAQIKVQGSRSKIILAMHIMYVTKYENIVVVISFLFQ